MKIVRRLKKQHNANWVPFPNIMNIFERGIMKNFVFERIYKNNTEEILQ